MPVSATRWHARHVTFGSGTRPCLVFVCNHHPHPPTETPPFFLSVFSFFSLFPVASLSPFSIYCILFFSPPYLTSICIVLLRIHTAMHQSYSAHPILPGLVEIALPHHNFYLHILGIVTPIVGMHSIPPPTLSVSCLTPISRRLTCQLCPLPHKPCVLQVLAGNLASPAAHPLAALRPSWSLPAMPTDINP
ncbi:hypothetical protein GGI42DRAFT_4710 [Trichoderma sp. SZMC 28013]